MILNAREFLVIITAFLVGPRASAEESTPSNTAVFSFKIKHKYVNGDDNNIKHNLSAGTLTISGELWASRCGIERGTDKPAEPLLVKILVHQEGLFGGEKCSFAVVPSSNLGERTPFKITCANVRNSKFYIEAWTEQHPEPDFNCTIEATGKLVTR